MNDLKMWFEILGYTASIIVFVSLLMSSIIKCGGIIFLELFFLFSL